MNFYTVFTFVLYPVFFAGVFAFLFFTCDRVDEMDASVEKKFLRKLNGPTEKR